MTCYSPLAGYRDPETGALRFDRKGDGQNAEVACGQCLGCRLDRAHMWAVRITHEAQMCADGPGCCFVTLTYRDREHCDARQLKKGWHIPDDWSLKRADQDKGEQGHFQGFMKRLRKSRPGAIIKYFQCGEYGVICKHRVNLEQAKCQYCKVGRPHHHACLFNVSFPDKEAYAIRKGETQYTSKELEKLWRYGFVNVGELTLQSAGYTARYCLKKVTGDRAKDHYKSVSVDGEIVDLEPEYATMSNGIGKSWYEKYSNDVYPSNDLPVPGQGVQKKIPRYYDEILRKESEEVYEEIKEKRIERLGAKARENTNERLHSKYIVKKAAIKTLGRDL